MLRSVLPPPPTYRKPVLVSAAWAAGSSPAGKGPLAIGVLCPCRFVPLPAPRGWAGTRVRGSALPGPGFLSPCGWRVHHLSARAAHGASPRRCPLWVSRSGPAAHSGFLSCARQTSLCAGATCTHLPRVSVCLAPCSLRSRPSDSIGDAHPLGLSCRPFALVCLGFTYGDFLPCRNSCFYLG